MDWLIGKSAWAKLSTWASLYLHIDPGTLGNVLQTVLLLLMYAALRTLIRRTLLPKIDDIERRYRVNRALRYALTFFLIVMLAQIWFLGRVNLATYLGILSAGLAIALQDPIVNIAGWIFIFTRQPFKVGDRIQLGEDAGDVVDIGMFTFSMLEVGNWVQAEQSTGRIIHIPNGRVFKQPCANYTHGFDYVWHEIPVVVTFESNWKKAHDLLTAIVKQEAEDASATVKRQVHAMAETYRVTFKHLTPIVWLEVVDIGIKLTVRYLCYARARRSTQDRMWRSILHTFETHQDIDFAYPTQRMYFNNLEGKPQTGGPRRSPAPKEPPPG